jgi:hypothetical protein
VVGGGGDDDGRGWGVMVPEDSRDSRDTEEVRGEVRG